MTENNTKITIAVIGLVGILGGAFFANWDKVFQSSLPDPTPPENGGHEPDIPRKPPQERPPPKEPNEQAEISQRLEELHRDLENHDREIMKAHEVIERLRPFHETDRETQQEIERQERWLEELEMDRNNVQREFDHLREQR